MERLVDNYKREITDIRISLTDRCNLNCFYCHNEGLGETRDPRGPRDNEMSTKKVLQIARIAHELGIRNYKFTGGEPLLRKDLEKIIQEVSKLQDVEVSLTTNGTFLKERAFTLKSNGLKRVNISMDTNDPDEFREITQGGINRVYEGIDAALEADLTPVKLNMVMAKTIRPYLEDMIKHVCSNEGMHLQIIEYMPELVGGEEYYVDIDQIKRKLKKKADNIKTRRIHNRNKYIIDGSVVEVVDPVENPEFCANCNRLRVTHDGKLKGCLNRNNGLIPLDSDKDKNIREKFYEVVENRVPYYGEYMIKNEKGEWMKNPEYKEKKKENSKKLPVIT